MLINPNQSFPLTFSTIDATSSWDVAAKVYDVTTGTPVLVSTVTLSPTIVSGVYVGAFTPAADKAYFVITGVFTDGTFATPDTDYSPDSANFETYTTDTSILNFNYSAYDQNATLTISATVFNATDNIHSSVSLSHVAMGAYYGRFVGAVGKSYYIAKLATDLSYSPGSDEFQGYDLAGGSGSGAGTITLPGIVTGDLTGSGDLTGNKLSGTLEA